MEDKNAHISRRSISGETIILNEQLIEELTARIRGRILTPQNDEYDQLRQIWNAMIDRRPALIIQCSGTADVIHAVKFAKAHHCLVTIRGAGHNIAGKSLSGGAILIDLSTLSSVHVDPDTCIAIAGPGAGIR